MGRPRSIMAHSSWNRVHCSVEQGLNAVAFDPDAQRRRDRAKSCAILALALLRLASVFDEEKEALRPSLLKPNCTDVDLPPTGSKCQILLGSQKASP